MSKDILTIKEAAEELNADEIAVMRVISRQALKAVQVGSGQERPWRVTRDSLLQFVSAGAADLQMPTIQSGWFDNSDLSEVMFQSEVKKATETQRLSDDEIRSRAKQSPGVRSFTQGLTVSPSVRRIINTPLGTRFRFNSVGDDFYAAQLRAFVRRSMKPIASVTKFYSDPAAYNETVNTAVVGVLAQKVSYPESRHVDGSTYTITYELSNAIWMPADRAFEVVRKTF